MQSNIIFPFPKKYDTPSEKVKKACGPLPKKSDAPSENVKKASGDRWLLLFTKLTKTGIFTRFTKKEIKN